MDRHPRPVMVAIGGDSGTGKTTLTRGLADLFGAENILTLCLDDYHTLDREARRRLGITALNPVANNIALMEDHVWALREGRGITKPVYDHTTGTLAAPEAVEPRPLVVVRGLFPLFTERLRAAFDVAVWLDPDEELKYHWKLQRDVAQRGHTVEGVIRQIVERQEDVRRYILPQRAHADMLIRFLPPPGYFPHSGRREAVSLNVQIRQAAHWFPSELRALALDGQGEWGGSFPPPVPVRGVGGADGGPPGYRRDHRPGPRRPDRREDRGVHRSSLRQASRCVRGRRVRGPAQRSSGPDTAPRGAPSGGGPRGRFPRGGHRAAGGGTSWSPRGVAWQLPRALCSRQMRLRGCGPSGLSEGIGPWRRPGASLPSVSWIG